MVPFVCDLVMVGDWFPSCVTNSLTAGTAFPVPGACQYLEQMWKVLTMYLLPWPAGTLSHDCVGKGAVIYLLGTNYVSGAVLGTLHT